MSDKIDDNGQSMEDLLDAYDEHMSVRLRKGDKVTGRIIAIGKDTVFVDTGTKIDGTVAMSELLAEDGSLPCKVGDEVALYVVDINSGGITLSRALSGDGGLAMLDDAFSAGMPVDGRVTATCKGGFSVDILHRRAFCPISQIDTSYVEDADAYVGQNFRFLITEFKEKGRNLVVSRRRLLEQEQEKVRGEFLTTLNVGEVRDVKVLRIMPYGCFVEFTPGVEGFVHISELSWAHLDKCEDAVAVGLVVSAKVISMEPGDKEGRMKIGLSVKQAAGDPWEGELPFAAGDKIEGKVVRLAPFGCFVELVPGIEGLVHISEMSYVKRIMHPKEVVSEGEKIMVLIKQIDLDERRISLSIKDAEGDPWAGITERFHAGQTCTGTVEKQAKFGCFVTLEPGVTGLVPRSKMGDEASKVEALKPGAAITVNVVEVRPQQRQITLSVGDGGDDGDWKGFADHTTGSATTSLGDMLQKAMKGKR